MNKNKSEKNAVLPVGGGIIEIKNLVKNFPIGNDIFTALKKIDLNIAEGEFTGLVGPSGSGKTTLLNIIGTLDKPSKGTVNVLGNNVENLSPTQSAQLRKEEMGFIFQSYNLLPVYTVYENVEFPLILLHTHPDTAFAALRGWKDGFRA